VWSFTFTRLPLQSIFLKIRTMKKMFLTAINSQPVTYSAKLELEADLPTMQSNNWDLPLAFSKVSDPNWLGGAGSPYRCEPMFAGLAGHSACEAANDEAWRVAA
jgi:hypothetical protein